MSREKNFFGDKSVEILVTIVIGFIGIITSCMTTYLQNRSDITQERDELKRQLYYEKMEFSHERTNFLCQVTSWSDRFNREHSQAVKLRDELTRCRSDLEIIRNESLEKSTQLTFYQVSDFQKNISSIGNMSELLGKLSNATDQVAKIVEPRVITNNVVVASFSLVWPSESGIFIPVPREFSNLISRLSHAWNNQDYMYAITLANSVFPMVEPLVQICKDREILAKREFGAEIALVYRIKGEEMFSKNDFSSALAYFSIACQMLGKKPPVSYLAREVIANIRLSRYSVGFMTHHVVNASNNFKDKNYTIEFIKELAHLGYLQRHYPSKEKELGEFINWKKILKADIPDEEFDNRNGELWGQRWCGFDCYEEYNYTKITLEGFRILKDMENKCK